MTIRKARMDDEQAIARLMEQLSYPSAKHFLRDKMLDIFVNPKSEIWVYQKSNDVNDIIAFLSVDILTQVGSAGDLARINYIGVDHKYQNSGIGGELLEFFETYAVDRNCTRIELPSDSQILFGFEGYSECPGYFMKSLEHMPVVNTTYKYITPFM